VTVETTPAFSAASASWKIMASAVLFERHPLERPFDDARLERAFDDVARSQMLPMLGRQVVEGEQHIAILNQALDRLVDLTPQVSTNAPNATSASLLVSAI
jgi:hypothetical protein